MSNPWDDGVYSEVESFEHWMSRFENQQFVSLQGAFGQWLDAQGFAYIGDDYSMAVQVILVYLSYCIANPKYRRYLSHPDNYDDQPEVVEYTILQVNVPEEDEERTFWEFLTEANFHTAYANWNQGRHPSA